MSSISDLQTLSRSWRFALIGAIASLPLITIIDGPPNSSSDIGGGVVIFGAFIAGSLAAIRSSNPSDAGLRAGVIAVVLTLIVFIVTEVPTMRWSLLKVVNVMFYVAVVACITPLFGQLFGRIGGWVTNKSPIGG